MNDPAKSIETLFEKVGDYGNTTIELFKLNAIDKSAEVVSTLATRLIIYLVIAFFIFTLSIGLSLWIGELLGKSYYGFFVIAGCYALVSILLYAFRHPWIREPLNNSIIIQMLKKKPV